MSKPKIIDLQKCEDGTYSPNSSKSKSVVMSAKKKEEKPKTKPKYVMNENADEFLAGLDVGLDLVESIKSRAIRILGLRD
jgi:hypoxanthine-guanine phosphoribosyltransferase